MHNADGSLLQLNVPAADVRGEINKPERRLAACGDVRRTFSHDLEAAGERNLMRDLEMIQQYVVTGDLEHQASVSEIVRSVRVCRVETQPVRGSDELRVSHYDLAVQVIDTGRKAVERLALQRPFTDADVS